LTILQTFILKIFRIIENLEIMNLQTGKNKITFNSNGDKIIGWLFCPPDFDESKKYPAITLAGPLGSVKEQAAGVFGEKLSKKGFVTLAFDFSTQGESGGTPKNYDNPFRKGEDVQSAISFLGTLENIDNDRIGALGICAGSSYTMHGIVSDARVKAFATVVAHFSLREFTGYNPMINDEVRSYLLNQSNEARQLYFESGEESHSGIIYPDAKTKEDLPFSGPDADDIYDYYYSRVAGCWPNFNSQMATMSYEALIKSQALDLAKDLSIPYLGITGTEAFSKPYTERFLSEMLHDKKEMKIIEGARHIQCYDIEKNIDEAVDYLTVFYKQHL